MILLIYGHDQIDKSGQYIGLPSSYQSFRNAKALEDWIDSKYECLNSKEQKQFDKTPVAMINRPGNMQTVTYGRISNLRAKISD